MPGAVGKLATPMLLLGCTLVSRKNAPAERAVAAAAVVDTIDWARRDNSFRSTCDSYRAPADTVTACLRAESGRAGACAGESVWAVAFDAPGRVNRVELRRCGPQEARWDSAGGSLTIVYPVRYLIVRDGPDSTALALYVSSNADEPGIGGLYAALPGDFDHDGRQELALVYRIDGTGAVFEGCVLAHIAGGFHCWESVDVSAALYTQLKAGETLRKGPIPVPGPTRPPFDSWTGPLGDDGTFWWFMPVYAESDANCCSSVNQSLWLQLVPRSGRLELGKVLRSVDPRPDSTAAASGRQTT